MSPPADAIVGGGGGGGGRKGGTRFWVLRCTETSALNLVLSIVLNLGQGRPPAACKKQRFTAAAVSRLCVTVRILTQLALVDTPYILISRYRLYLEKFT